MTLISIIIPYHNSAASDRSTMLDELIQSIPDRDDVEIIAVDDRSEVAWTPKLTPKNAELKLLKNRPDWRFAGTARNAGLEAAAGKYVLFADSDDRYDTASLNDLIEHAKDTSDVDVFLFRMGSFLDSGEEGTRHAYLDAHLNIYLETGKNPLRSMVSPCTKLIKRSVITEYELRFGDTKYANDAEFAVSLYLCDPKFKVWDETIYYARQGNQGLTTDPSIENILTRIKVFKRTNLMLRKAGIKETILLVRFRRDLKRHPFRISLELLKSATQGHKVFPNFGEMMHFFNRRVMPKIMGKFQE